MQCHNYCTWLSDIDIHFLTSTITVVVVVLLLLKIEGEMGKIALAVIVSLWVIPTTVMVNHIVPEPYMVRKKFIKLGNRQLLILKLILKKISLYSIWLMSMICRMKYFIYHRHSSTAREILEVGTLWLPLLLACMFFSLWYLCLWPHLQENLIPLAYIGWSFMNRNSSHFLIPTQKLRNK